MKRKKLIYISLITVFTVLLTIIPIHALNANSEEVLDDNPAGEYQSYCGTNQHSIKYNVQDGIKYRYLLDTTIYAPPGWNSNSFFYNVEFYADGGVHSKDIDPECFKGEGVDSYWLYYYCYTKSVSVREEVWPDSSKDIIWIKFYYTGSFTHCPEPEPEPTWTRTMPMMCQYVWINKDNNFQFKFLYPYADNNWVKIYKMNEDGTAGEEVFEADMPYMNPNLIVDLPDGMYIVMTFNDDMANPIQTFTIGKPAPDMEM
jgi:hypothetical protein